MFSLARVFPPQDLSWKGNENAGARRCRNTWAFALVSDRIQSPFGLEHSVTGPAAIPVRFPGQYVDDESGLSYKYSRDYDPRLGRYIQSDSIGQLNVLHPG